MGCRECAEAPLQAEADGGHVRESERTYCGLSVGQRFFPSSLCT